MANKLNRLGGPGKFGAWVRYGGKPITQQQLDFAVKNYSVAILQPWELDAARYLKKRAPQMVVLAYKCLSSTRSYEPGPIYSSGVSYPLAQSMANSGKDFFAHRLNGDRIEWKGLPQALPDAGVERRLPLAVGGRCGARNARLTLRRGHG